MIICKQYIIRRFRSYMSKFGKNIKKSTFFQNKLKKYLFLHVLLSKVLNF